MVLLHDSIVQEVPGRVLSEQILFIQYDLWT